VIEEVEVAYLMDAGTFGRLQNQIKMPETSNCVAQTPPPAWAKPGPKLFGAVSPTMHPEGCEQSASPDWPFCEGGVVWVHPGVVCNAI
jgi:hypothetical protein